ncbi:MAG TPA: hypothetical protein VF828_03480 [Patescibacteria group bacterium]
MKPRTSLILSIIANLEFLALCLVVLYYFSYYQPHHRRPIPVVKETQAMPDKKPTESPLFVSANIGNSALTTPAPTSASSSTTTVSGSQTIFRDEQYNYKISYPNSWTASVSPPTSISLETYTIKSTDQTSSVEVLISEGDWNNVKLEIGVWSKYSRFAGKQALIRTDSAETDYVFPSTNDGQIVRITLKGTSPQLTKILNSFKFI